VSLLMTYLGYTRDIININSLIREASKFVNFINIFRIYSIILLK